jgi:hypothetical protein
VRYLANQEYMIVARFRRRDDAVAYLQVLCQANQRIVFVIIFNAPIVNKSLTSQTLN